MLAILVSTAFIQAQIEKMDSLLPNNPVEAAVVYQQLRPMLENQDSEGAIIAHLKGFQAAAYASDLNTLTAISSDLASPYLSTAIQPYLGKFLLALGATLSKVQQYANAATIYKCATNYASDNLRYSLAINNSIVQMRLHSLTEARKALLPIDMDMLDDRKRASLFNQYAVINEKEGNVEEAYNNYKKTLHYATKADNINALIMFSLNMQSLILKNRTHLEEYIRYSQFTQGLLQEAPSLQFQHHLELLDQAHRFIVSKDPSQQETLKNELLEIAQNETNPAILDLLWRIEVILEQPKKVENIESDYVKTNALALSYCQFVS